MKIARRQVLLSALATVILGLIVWGFVEGRKELATEAERERPVKALSRVVIENGQPIVVLDEATQAKADITTTPLAAMTTRKELMAYGTVLSPQDLVQLRNDYGAARAQADKGRAALAASRKDYERMKTLHADDRNVSDKDLQAAEALWQANEAEGRAAQDALSAVERKAEQQWGSQIAKAVQENAPLFMRLMQQQNVLLQITLPLGASVATPSPDVRVQNSVGSWNLASLISAAPRTDTRLQGLSSFYVTDAQGLVPGMTVSARVPMGLEVKGVVVPAAAVLWWQGKAWAYVVQAKGRFARREVPTDHPVNEGWFAAQSLVAGNAVVNKGAQLLLSEELSSQIQVGEEGGEK
jgi:hypothetical protein